MAEKKTKKAEAQNPEEIKKAPEEVEEPVAAKEETVLKSQYDELNDSYLRLLAEFNNFKKRTEKEKLEIKDYATASVIANMLSVCDALEIAAATECSDESYKKGVDLTLSSLKEVLKNLKVEEIYPLGEKFDPLLHNAVMTEENENFPENAVSMVLQKGYKVGEKVIRPAMVKVANA